MKIQLRRPYFPSNSIKRIQQKINKAICSGILSLGKNVKEFEERFAKFQNTKYAVGVSSATAGLQISLLSLNIGENDEVIVPAKTFISTAFAPLYCNAKPVFCDVDELTYQLDPSKIEKLITRKTKAIIPVHLGGNICPMNEILEMANKHNIHVIEDAAHANGSTLNGKRAGSFGRLGVFSFYPDKVMVSSDGGAIITNDKKLYDKLLLLRNIGRRRTGIYEFSVVGYNYRMNELQAILAIEQLRLLPNMLKKRRQIAQKYDDAFDKILKFQTPKMLDGVKSAYYAYILKLKRGSLVKLRSQLARKGIETSPMFTTLYKTEVFEKILGEKRGLCPVSEDLDDKTFTIPLHPGMTKDQIQYVIKEIKRLVQ